MASYILVLTYSQKSLYLLTLTLLKYGSLLDIL